MFGWSDFFDALMVLCLAVMSRPMLLRERPWGVPVIDVHDLNLLTRERIGVLVHGRQAGLLPRLLAFFGTDVASTFEVDEESVTLKRAGILRSREKTIRLEDVETAEYRERSPVAALVILAVIGAAFLMLAERLSSRQADAAVFAAFVGVFIWILGESVELVVEATDGTRIAVAFSRSGSGNMTEFDALHITEIIKSRADEARRRVA